MLHYFPFFTLLGRLSVLCT